nr:MAG TPA: hypothetical protein [Caudoviricetes sp.]
MKLFIRGPEQTRYHRQSYSSRIYQLNQESNPAIHYTA